jgi:hypothetical protein
MIIDDFHVVRASVKHPYDAVLLASGLKREFF